MITSAYNNSWPMDFEINDLKSCGLEKGSTIRFKLFTMDHRLIKAKIGHLSIEDQALFKKNAGIVFEQILM